MESIKIVVVVPPRVAIIEGKTKWGTLEFSPTDEQLAALTVTEREALYRHRVKSDRTEQVPLRIDSATAEWNAIVAGLRASMQARARRIHEIEQEEARRQEALPRVAACMRSFLHFLPDSATFTDEQALSEGIRVWIDIAAKALPVDASRVRRVRMSTAEWHKLKVVRRKSYTPQAGAELAKLAEHIRGTLPRCFTLDSYVARIVSRQLDGQPRALPFTAVVLEVGTEAGQAVALLVRSDASDEKSSEEG
jgi:hypothetical protein